MNVERWAFSLHNISQHLPPKQTSAGNGKAQWFSELFFSRFFPASTFWQLTSSSWKTRMSSNHWRLKWGTVKMLYPNLTDGLIETNPFLSSPVSKKSRIQWELRPPGALFRTKQNLSPQYWPDAVCTLRKRNRPNSTDFPKLLLVAWCLKSIVWCYTWMQTVNENSQSSLFSS